MNTTGDRWKHCRVRWPQVISTIWLPILCSSVKSDLWWNACNQHLRLITGCLCREPSNCLKRIANELANLNNSDEYCISCPRQNACLYKKRRKKRKSGTSHCKTFILYSCWSRSLIHYLAPHLMFTVILKSSLFCLPWSSASIVQLICTCWVHTGLDKSTYIRPQRLWAKNPAGSMQEMACFCHISIQYIFLLVIVNMFMACIPFMSKHRIPAISSKF